MSKLMFVERFSFFFSDLIRNRYVYTFFTERVLAAASFNFCLGSVFKRY